MDRPSNGGPPNGNLLDAFTTAFPDTGFVFDTSGRIVRVFAGPGTDLLLFEDPDTAVGQTITDVFRERTADRIQATIERTLETGDLQRTEYIVETEVGSHAFEARTAPVKTDDDAELVVMIARDVTTRDLYEKRLDEKNRILQVIQASTQAITRASTVEELETAICEILTNSSPYLFAWIGRYDEEGERIVPTAWTGTSETSLTSLDLAATDDRPPHPTVRTALTSQPQIVQNVHDASAESDWTEQALAEGYHAIGSFPVTYDGELRRTLTIYAERPYAFDFGERELVAELCSDIAFAEEALQARERLQVREEELARLNTEWEILNRIVRHDIRNKMTVVLGRAELLSDLVSPEGEDHLRRLLETSQQVVDITTEARDVAVSLTGRQQASLEEQNLTSTLLTEVEATRNSYPNATVTVTDELPNATVRGNEFLSSVFRNVLTNAIIHNDERTPEVTVSVETTEDRVAVRIADNGPGIPDDLKRTIFEKETQSVEHGLGLYLVHSLVDMFQGTLSIEDNHPKGSVFVVDLPLAR
jgi:PAS domain S-box-containing protein